MEQQHKKEYPSWRYHEDGRSRLIESPDQEEDGWTSSPADHGIETAPGGHPDPAIAARKKSADAAAAKKK